jgi:hypothetical protein
MLNISEDVLRKLYVDEGMTTREIATHFGCSQPVICDRLRAYGIPARAPNDYRRLDLPYDKLYELYVNQLQTVATIADHLGCSDAAALKYLKAYRIPMRPPGGSNRLAAHCVPSELYDTTITPDVAYALGLLASDGCLPRGNNQVNLISTDAELIELFMGCLQLHPAVEPHYRERRQPFKPFYELEFSDAGFRAFLECLGLTPGKSKTIGRLAIPDNVFPDFVRGAWDGDGSWMVEKRQGYLNASFCSASPVYLVWIQENIARLANLHGGIYGVKLVYYGSKAVALGRWMYYAPDLPALSRKRAIWEQLAAKIL